MPRLLAAQVAEATEAEQVAADLARHLQSNHFQKWLLEEAVARLVDGATDVLRQLSNGAYSFTQDRRGGNFAGNFSVIDHRNADGVRSARTLSGGETFLASLALALALADQVAELARPVGDRTELESIFLDEGFGTLDPETLDTVAGAIEELGQPGPDGRCRQPRPRPGRAPPGPLRGGSGNRWRDRDPPGRGMSIG